jgi:hypothetical protein
MKEGGIPCETPPHPYLKHPQKRVKEVTYDRFMAFVRKF